MVQNCPSSNDSRVGVVIAAKPGPTPY
uniref:Uncharacterized protein n=1 Tax=Anguilla anguilla TaxID=7936 RepID=A0A0E9RMT9_ANGAN